MSFAIEVPGEAIPLSLQELCRVLQSAQSHDFAQRRSAGQQLESWEAHQEYYASLQSVFLDKSLPREIRLLAITQLKNGIDKYWRHHTLKNAIQPAQKDLIRSRLYQGTIGEADRLLALHNALVIAKIVRIDFPQAWPDALTTLISILRTAKDGDQTELSGALLVVLRIVKELGTARLRKSQTALQSVTPELVFLLGEIYTSSSSSWIALLSSGQGSEESTYLGMQNSLVAFKTLRRLLIVGYEYPHKDKVVQQAWSLSQSQFGQFLNFVSSGASLPDPCLDMVGKHLVQFTKLHVEMSSTHPASFAALPSSFDLVRAYWDLVCNFAAVFDKSGGLHQEPQGRDGGDAKSRTEGPLLEKLALKGLLLVLNCIKMVNQPQLTFKYRSAEVKEEQAEQMKNVKTNLLTDDMIISMANVIVSNLLVFRQADLEAWEDEHEAWEQQEETQGNAWEWEVRPCAERVLQQLLVSYKQLLMQPLLSYFELVKDPQADVMKKEAVYTSIGLAAAHVEGRFNFDELLKSTVVQDAQQQGPLCKVLRRRIAILLSQWIPIGVATESRPLIYEIYRHFLNANDENNDIVVRITAARQFRWVVEDFKFEGEMFRPFAEGILRELVQLLQQVEIDETKLAILDTTRLIIERMDTHVVGFADLVMSALPAIWESAGDLGYMMKQAVLTILQSLVMSMKEESRRYHSVILPLIAEAVQEGSDVFLYLIDEALELWSNVLLQSPPPLSQELLSLAEPAITQLEAHTEHHLSNLSIVGSYILLAPEMMLGDQLRNRLLKALSESFESKKRELLLITTKYTEAVVRLAEQLGGVGGLKAVTTSMIETGLLTKILEGIHDAYLAHQTSGPNRRQPRRDNLALTDYFSVLSRIAVADPATFVDALTSLGPIDQIWSWLGAEWFASFDCMSDDTRKKLNMLALTRLSELGPPMQELVLARLQDYFTMWTSVLTSVLSSDEVRIIDLLVFEEPLHATEYDTPKDIRERELLMSDPIRQCHSLNFVQERLGALVQRIGGEQAFQNNYAVNVDADVLNGFKAASTPGALGS